MSKRPQPTTNERLDILATIEKKLNSGTLKVNIKIHSEKTDDMESLFFDIAPAIKDELTFGKLLQLFEWKSERATIDFAYPDTHPPLFDVVIGTIQGELTDEGSRVAKDDQSTSTGNTSTSGDTGKKEPVVKVTTKKSMNLKSFHVAVHTKQSITILNDPQIEILQIVLDVTYRKVDAKESKTGISGILYGKLQIGKLLLKLAYLSDAGNGESAFWAEGDLNKLLDRPENAPARADGKDAIGMDVLATASSMKTADVILLEELQLKKDMIKPNTIGARVRTLPTNKIEVWASGKELWSGDICGVNIKLANLTALFRFTQGKTKPAPNNQDREPSTYEGYLRGDFDFKDYKTIAQLSIGPKANATLTALLEKKDHAEPGNINVFEQLTDDMNKTSSSSDVTGGALWKDIVPKFQEAMIFNDQSKLFFYADFNSKKIVVSANIKNFGAVLLLGQQITREGSASKKVRKYIFFLEAYDLNRLWSEPKEDVAKQFNISKLFVQVIGYDTNVKQLREDISVVTASIADGKSQKDENDKEIDPFNAAPAKTAMDLYNYLPKTKQLKAGAWFFAQIDFQAPGRLNMTNVIAFDSSNHLEKDELKAPTVRLYARVVKKKEQVQTDPSSNPVPDPNTQQPGPQLDEKSEYDIDIRNLQIFDGAITLNGLGQYFPDSKDLRVTGDLRLKLGEEQPKELLFNIKFKMDRSGTKFKVSTETQDPSIKNPIGRLGNLSLRKLTIVGSSIRKENAPAERKCTIWGEATFGDATQSSLLGLIHFEKGRPVLIVVEYSKKVIGNAAITDGYDDFDVDATPKLENQPGNTSISGIYSNIISTDVSSSNQSASWPSEEQGWDDFELLEAYVSYNRSENIIQIGDRPYEPSLFMYASFMLFQRSVKVSLKFIEDKQHKWTGFEMKGAITDTIDLSILQLTSYDDDNHKVKGLSLSMNTSGEVRISQND